VCTWISKKIEVVKQDDRGTIYNIEGIDVVVWKKGSKSSEHSHDTKEIIYVVKGKMRLTVNDEEKIINESETITVPEKIQRTVEALEDMIIIEKR